MVPETERTSEVSAVALREERRLLHLPVGACWNARAIRDTASVHCAPQISRPVGRPSASKPLRMLIDRRRGECAYARVARPPSPRSAPGPSSLTGPAPLAVLVGPDCTQE